MYGGDVIPIGMRRVVAGLGMVVAGAAPALSAQSVEIEPFLGSYLPLMQWGELRELTATSTFSQTTGVLAGARLRYTVNNSLGFELGGSYVNTGWIQDRSSTTSTAAGNNVGISLRGHLIEADARATFRPRRTNVFGIAGVGMQTRGGRAWDASIWPSAEPTVYNKSNLTGIVGLGLRAAASPRIRTDVTAELHVYSASRVDRGFAFVNSTFENKKTQADFVLTVGIPITLLQR
jgi:hypothetical protein